MEQETRRYTFPKSEHLCGEIRIAELFRSGKKFLVHPVKVTFSRVEKEAESVKLLIVVPKRNFKHAVDRNRIKRLLREVYRKQSHIIKDKMTDKDFSLYIAFNFISDEMPDYKLLERKMKRLLMRLSEEISK